MMKLTDKELNHAIRAEVVGTVIEGAAVTAASYFFFKHVLPRLGGFAFFALAILLSPAALVYAICRGETDDAILLPLSVVAVLALLFYHWVFRSIASHLQKSQRREAYVSDFLVSEQDHKALKVVLGLLQAGEPAELVQLHVPEEWNTYRRINAIRSARQTEFDAAETAAQYRKERMANACKLVEVYLKSGYAEAEVRAKHPSEWALHEETLELRRSERIEQNRYGWGHMLAAIMITSGFFVVLAVIALSNT